MSPRLPRWAVAAAAAIAALALPATAPAETPVVGKNAELVTQLPEAAGAIAMQFSVERELMVLSTLKGIHTYDVSEPTQPRRVGYLPMGIYQNEDMELFERGDRAYALIASNGAVAGLKGTTPELVTNNRRVLVVDVSDPAAPALLSSVATPTRTHTISCGDPSCQYAYSDGRTQGEISIVDLRDPANPKAVGQYASVVPQGHDQDLDDRGILWHVGGQGSVALDVTDPLKPVPLNSTDEQGVGSRDYSGRPYNNFIHHNSFRPNAGAFDDASGSSGEPSVDRGNVLLVTEEDYLTVEGAGRCGDYEGSFQTWHIPWLDGERYAAQNSAGAPGGGTIAPLDRWNTELLDSGQQTPAGAFCSAHYFDYLDSGFVAQGWYQQGTRILDVRDPTDIKQVGYFFTGASETWAAYWVPRKLSRRETIVYTADAVRGVDVLKVTLPRGKPEKTRSVRAPILKQWLKRDRTLAGRSSADWGYLCPLPRA